MGNKKIEGLGGLPQSNMFENLPDFTKAVHVRENKKSNEDHLNANRQKFTGQCAIVLSLLQKGQVLSSASALLQWKIGHLPRRIKDLRDNEETPIVIDEQYQYDSDGKTTRNKIWFIKDRLTEATKIKYKIK